MVGARRWRASSTQIAPPTRISPRSRRTGISVIGGWCQDSFRSAEHQMCHSERVRRFQRLAPELYHPGDDAEHAVPRYLARYDGHDPAARPAVRPVRSMTGCPPTTRWYRAAVHWLPVAAAALLFGAVCDRRGSG